MPSSPLQEFIGSLDPVDVATLFGGLRTAVPAGMAAYSGELNAGEAEWIARRRAERDAAAMREMEILRRLLPQAMARRQGQAVGPAPDVFVPTRPRVMRESPFMFTQPRSTPVPQQYAGGGKVEALKMLKGDLWHGGSYKKGQTITQPLYLSPSRELAESYVEPDRVPGSVLQKLRAEVKRPAPERLVRAASRKFVPENEASGYTPASAFDANLHDPELVAQMIRELRRRGYDSAVASDVGMGTGVEAPALVLFPGSKAFAKGGKVATKTLDEMQAELMSKEGLSRRSLFGLKPQYPVAKVNEPLSKVEQEVKRIEQQAGKSGLAPKVSTARVEVDPGTGSRKSVMESIAETPLSRRQVLKTAASQAAQSVLPVGDIAKLVGAPAVTSPVGAIAQAAKAAMPLVPMTVQGVIARAAKMGLNEDETVALLKKMGMADEADVQYMLPTMRSPYDFYEDLGIGEMSRARAMANLINEDLTKPMAMRGPLREIRRENPAMYQELKRAAQDIADYGQEF